MAGVAPITQVLENARVAAAKLPVCDGAARLHALFARVVTALENGENPTHGADELLLAATDALERDPWTQFERAARALQATISAGRR